jgi:hypothetical protein
VANWLFKLAKAKFLLLIAVNWWLLFSADGKGFCMLVCEDVNAEVIVITVKIYIQIINVI